MHEKIQRAAWDDINVRAIINQHVIALIALWQETALLMICIWSSCRFYYFLFHVLHAYVDPSLKSAGIMDLLRKLRSRE